MKMEEIKSDLFGGSRLRSMRTSEYEKIDKERIKNERTTEGRGRERALI